MAVSLEQALGRISREVSTVGLGGAEGELDALVEALPAAVLPALVGTLVLQQQQENVLYAQEVTKLQEQVRLERALTGRSLSMGMEEFYDDAIGDSHRALLARTARIGRLIARLQHRYVRSEEQQRPESP